MRRFLVVSMVILGLGALPKAADAGVITGDLQITGAVEVGADFANWFQGIVAGAGVNPNIWNITGSSIQDDGVDVTALQFPKTIHETNLSAVTTPPGEDISVDLFEYALDPTLPVVDFVLNYVLTCPELGALYTCVGFSPFGFIQNLNGSTTIALSMRGVVFDTATPTIQSLWSGLWTTNVNIPLFGGPGTIQGIIEGGGTILNSASATKITTFQAVPEPATLLTFGAAMAFLVAHRRRQAKNRA